MNAGRGAAIAAGLALGSLLSSGSGVVAQTKAPEKVAETAGSLTVPSKRYDAEKELARLAKVYKLTDAQQAKIKPILLEQQKQVHALGEDESLTNQEYAGEMRKVHAQTVAAVKKEMTDLQATQYAKDEAKLAKKSGDDSGDDDFGPPDGMPPGPPPGGFEGGPPM